MTQIPTRTRELSVGQLAERSGVAVSALHFYEAQGLISARRTSGNPLARIKGALSTLPASRTPTPRDWARLSAAWRDDLDDRIRQLQSLRDKLTGCIGCGCLSIGLCKLANPDDVLGNEGAGPRNL
jgi:MerR family redox-sensitive transcriptional activator SoxR